MKNNMILSQIKILFVVIGLLSYIAIPTIATAAAYNVATYTDLQEKLSATLTTDTIILINDITNGNTQLDVNGTKTLDLNGKNLTITIYTAMNCIKINPGATLIIKDSNPSTNKLSIKNGFRFSSSGMNAGINTSDGMLFVESGTIEAKGGSNAAGIGGGRSSSGGNITINGGNVISNGGENAAGIGSGSGSIEESIITINGGNVIATGGGGDAEGGAGIGRGSSSRGGIFTINGGNVTAKGSIGAAGIGSGKGGYGGSVTINGGTVTANSSANGAGIGSGHGGSMSSIDIKGGNVTAKGGVNGSGIGGGLGTSGGNITISGGNVVAQGGDYGAGIGGGHYGKSEYISITGGRVTATRGVNAIYDLGQGVSGELPDKLQITGGSVKVSNMSLPPTFPKNESSMQIYLLTVICNSGVDIASNITSGSYVAPARHSETPAIDSKSYLWLPEGSNNINVKMLGLDFTNNVDILTDNTSTQAFQNISTNPNYVVCCVQSDTNMRFNVASTIIGSKPIQLFITAYDNSRKVIIVSSKKIDCPQNQSVCFEAQIPAVGTSKKIALWEYGSLMPLIDSITK